MIRIFSNRTADLKSTRDFNLNTLTDVCCLQFSVVHHHIVDEGVFCPGLVCRDKSLEFLRDVNQFFETQDRDSNPNVKGGGRNRAGMGLYCFNEKSDEE